MPGGEALLERLKGYDVRLIVMEATGGYEAALACALQAAGYRVAVVNPRQARDFAKGMGFLAKTDRLDAAALTSFAQALDAHPKRDSFIKPLADAECEQLAALVSAVARTEARADLFARLMQLNQVHSPVFFAAAEPISTPSRPSTRLVALWSGLVGFAAFLSLFLSVARVEGRTA